MCELVRPETELQVFVYNARMSSKSNKHRRKIIPFHALDIAEWDHRVDLFD